MFGFFPLELWGSQPRNRQIHRQVCWKHYHTSGVAGKQRNIGFVGLLRNVEQKRCRKYREWLCCKILVTKSKLKASLADWRNLLPYIFQGGLQTGSPPRRAAPGRMHYIHINAMIARFILAEIFHVAWASTSAEEQPQFLPGALKFVDIALGVSTSIVKFSSL